VNVSSSRSPTPILWLRIVCLAWLVGWLLAGSAVAGTMPQVRLGMTRSMAALPFYVAEAHGLFEAQGVRVTLQDCPDGHRCLAGLFGGQTQLATVTELPVAMTAFQRDDFAIVTTLGRSDRDIKILARGDAGIDGLDGLVGRRVAVPSGTVAQYHLEVALMLAGFDPRQVITVNVPPERIPAAMAAAEVDASVIWEPLARDILRDARSPARVLAGPKGLTHSFNLVASRAYIAHHEDTLVRVLRALDRAIEHIHRDPQQARELLAQRLDIPAEDIAARWSDYDFRLKLPQSLVGTLERQIRWLRREGHVPPTSSPGRAINVLHHLEPAALRRAVPDAVTLVK
jgi:ABC-type nitrate/sulfonate/bicarbonate transport system substrate-binding protein